MTQETPRAGGPPEARIPRSLLLGTVCRIQGSHVSGSCDQVDDTDEGLQQGNRGGDPQSQSEKTQRANCGKGARAMLRKRDAGEGEGPRVFGLHLLDRPEPPPPPALPFISYLKVPRRN